MLKLLCRVIKNKYRQIANNKIIQIYTYKKKVVNIMTFIYNDFEGESKNKSSASELQKQKTQLINCDAPIKVVNMETMIETLEGEQERPCFETFLDLNEPALMDDWTYRQLQWKKYGYAVVNAEDKVVNKMKTKH